MEKKVSTRRPRAALDPEKQRHQLLHSKGFIHPFMVAEDLRQSEFFIETMETFIAQSEQDEVSALSEQTKSMTDDEKSDFWGVNFPVHWDDIFGIRIRSAFCTQLCSQIEGTLSSVSNSVRILSRSPTSYKDVKGQSGLDQHRRYLREFGNFTGIGESLWKDVKHMFLVRNVHVHEQGYFGRYGSNEEFVAFLNSLPNIKTRSTFIELQAGSCPAFLNIAKRFHDALFVEYQALRDRLVLLEPS